ncbi:MAG: response regulator [Chloroflexota bacterium]
MAEQKRVLLVDDDVDFVEIIRTVLEEAGFNVITAYEGGDGLKKAREARPHVIVLDYMMTRPTEGAFVAQELKDDPDLRDIPIVLLTSVGSVHPWWGVKKHDEYLPVDVFLDKPIQPERLVEELRSLLNG